MKWAINDILWSWWEDHSNFKQHMYYISLLAEEVTWAVHDTSRLQYKDNDEEMSECIHFPDNFILAVKDMLIETAFEIVNDADYQNE